MYSTKPDAGNATLTLVECKPLLQAESITAESFTRNKILSKRSDEKKTSVELIFGSVLSVSEINNFADKV